MLHDPLVGAVCNPEEVWQMTDEMLVAQAQWLPQYAAAIPAAKARLATGKKTGTRVERTTGRRPPAHQDASRRCADRDAARKNAAAADKAGMTKTG